MRKRLVAILGEPLVERVEKTVALVAAIVRDGLTAAWDMLAGFIGNLKDTVFGAIRNWVVTKVVTTAFTRLITLFNPAGALIEAGRAIYTIITFFLDRAKQLAALTRAIFSSIGRIAAGAVDGAIGFIEQAMTRWLGRGSIAKRIKAIIQKIRAPVDKAITRLVNFIVNKARALVRRGKVPEKDKGVAPEAERSVFETHISVTVGDILHTLKPVRIGNRIELWLCTTCGKLTKQIDGVLAKLSSTGPTKSLYKRLRRLKDRVNGLEDGIKSGSVPFERLAAEANQIGAHLGNLGTKYPNFAQALNYNKITRPTIEDFDGLAQRLGFRRTSFILRGQPVYTDGRRYISPDVDEHTQSAGWKMADSVENLRSKQTRMGTYDANLNRFGD